MNLLLRELKTASDQGEEFQDRELSADEITLGSAQNQLIQLLGFDISGRHATLRASGGGLQVKALRGLGVEVNGARVKSASLAEGDVLKLGGHTLTRIAAPAGFDAALILDPEDVDSAAFEHAYRTSLDDTWMSKRAPGWTLGFLVLGIGLAIPLALLFDNRDDTPDPEAVLLTDAHWTSGPLHPAHNVAMGDDCGACHTQLFQRVADDACLSCHVNLADHVLPDHPSLEIRDVDRCASCHKEHNEPSYLVVDADNLCVDCHDNPGELEGSDAHMSTVSGFNSTDHPSFEVALLVPETDAKGTGLVFSWRTEEAKLSGASEASNLKFPHDLHLDPESVQTTGEGRALSCSDCHTLTADREHFEPVTMQQHCQQCHELTFDVNAPQRQLPHGQPLEVVTAMEGHFMRLYADPNRKADAPTRRRRPGRRGEGGGDSCTGSAYECATERTRVEVGNQFALRGCVTCHQVDDTGVADIYTRYQVHPVRLSHDFIPTARFDHRSHLTQKDAEGDDACLTCHNATASSTSTDLLVPDLDNCTSCHTDRFTDDDTVPLDCIDCHYYHPLDNEPMHFEERTL